MRFSYTLQQKTIWDVSAGHIHAFQSVIVFQSCSLRSNTGSTSVEDFYALSYSSKWNLAVAYK